MLAPVGGRDERPFVAVWKGSLPQSRLFGLAQQAHPWTGREEPRNDDVRFYLHVRPASGDVPRHILTPSDGKRRLFLEVEVEDDSLGAFSRSELARAWGR